MDGNYLYYAFHFLLMAVKFAACCPNENIDPYIDIEAKRFYIKKTIGFVNWYKAYYICRRENMELASIETEQENDGLVRAAIKLDGLNGTALWTSGSQLALEHTWVWLGTGRRIYYKNWSSCYPKASAGDCLFLSISAKAWKNGPCTAKTYGFALCETGVPPSSNGGVARQMDSFRCD